MQTDEHARGPEPSGRILIVDDLANWRETLGEILAEDGHTVLAAATPDGALALLRAHDVDVAILDMRLEDRDVFNVQGLRLLRDIRAASPRTRIMMLTGFPLTRLVDKIPAVYDVDAFWLKNPAEQGFDLGRFRQDVRVLVRKARQ